MRPSKVESRRRRSYGTPRVGPGGALPEVGICRPQSKKPFRKNFLVPSGAHLVRHHCRIDEASPLRELPSFRLEATRLPRISPTSIEPLLTSRWVSTHKGPREEKEKSGEGSLDRLSGPLTLLEGSGSLYRAAVMPRITPANLEALGLADDPSVLGGLR
jgi:hypothetical protein